MGKKNVPEKKKKNFKNEKKYKGKKKEGINVLEKKSYILNRWDWIRDRGLKSLSKNEPYVYWYFTTNVIPYKYWRELDKEPRPTGV